jgi:hypothetical protein
MLDWELCNFQPKDNKLLHMRCLQIIYEIRRISMHEYSRHLNFAFIFSRNCHFQAKYLQRENCCNIILCLS